MQKKRPWPVLLVVVAASTAAPAAWATGLGPGAQAAVLGAPLDFIVQVRTEAADPLVAECVSAEVHVGDRRLQPAQVRTVLEALGPESARIRVMTTQSIDEPVVGIQLHAGCAARVSRRYVVLADPPALAPAPLVTAPAYAAAPPQVPAPLPATAPPSGAAGVPAEVAGAGTPAVAQREAPERAAAQAAARAQRRAQAQARRAAAAANKPRDEAARAPRSGLVATAARVEPASRLRLDVSEPSVASVAMAATPVSSVEAQVIDQAFEAVAQAASAARAAAQAASATAQRIASLERTVSDLRSQAQSDRELAVQLRERLANTEGSGRWLWPLVTSVLVLAGLSLWLVRRLSELQRERNRAWRVAASIAPAAPASEISPSRQPTAPIPFVTAEVHPAPDALTRPRATPAWPPPAPAEPAGWQTVSTTQTLPLSMVPAVAADADAAVQRTDVLPPTTALRAEEPMPRDVSIEELIDLEQQAEFFVVLGQDDAAIDLLVEHLRNTGGGSPLPYLKLLEIYRRRGDREDYERTRTRFNHRFNAYAPDWGIDLSAGRSLEDYTGIVPRLQQVWPRPLDAMAEMEALLFRKSRGELFDLPAYREVLFLYSLARDLLDREAADTGSVDLLLPLADGGEFSVTSPAPYLGLERDTGPDTRPPYDDRPTAPVDLDLTAEHDRPTSIFDPFDAPTDPRMRRR